MTTLQEHKALLNELGQDRSNGYLMQTMLVAMCDVIEHLTAAPEPRYVDKPNQTQRIRELENTINQLKMQNKKLKAKVSERDTRIAALMHNLLCGQSGCRKDDTQVDGWIPWSGGECPVATDVVVFVMLRCDTAYPSEKEPAGCYRWDHRQESGDIIAYRIAE